MMLAPALCEPGAGRAQELIDGFAAVVDGEVITIAEVIRAARQLGEEGLAGCTADVPGSADNAASGEDTLTRARECLIDRTLVFREARRFPQLVVTRETIDAALARMRVESGSDDAFLRYLSDRSTTETELRQDIERNLLIDAYVNTRFRAAVAISPDSARETFDDEIVPDMIRRGIDPPRFADVADDFVVPLLVEREVNRRVQSWISDLRQRASILRFYP